MGSSSACSPVVELHSESTLVQWPPRLTSYRVRIHLRYTRLRRPWVQSNYDDFEHSVHPARFARYGQGLLRVRKGTMSLPPHHPAFILIAMILRPPHLSAKMINSEHFGMLFCTGMRRGLASSYGSSTEACLVTCVWSSPIGNELVSMQLQLQSQVQTQSSELAVKKCASISF
jgi:hypothetical protein